MTTSRLKEYKDNDFNEIIRRAEAVIADSERLEEGAVGNFLNKAGQKVGNAISNGVQKVAAWGGNVAAKAQAAAQQGYQQGQQEVQQQQQAQPQQQQQLQAPQQQQQAQLQVPQQQNQQQTQQQAPAENAVKPEEVKKIEQSVQEQDKKIDNLEKKVDELAKKKESLNRANRFQEADPPAAAPQTTYQKANGQTQGQNMRAMQNAANLKNNQKNFNQLAAHNIKNLRGDINAASDLIADNAEGISQNKAGIAQNTQAIQQQGNTIQQQGTQIQANADNLKTTAKKVAGVSQQLGKTTALAKQTATKVEEIVNSQASTEEKVAQLDTTAKETQATINQIQQAMQTGQTDQASAQKQIQELQAQLKQIQDLQKNTDQLNGKGNGLSPREAKVAQATLTQQLSSPAVAQKINSMLPQIGLKGTSFQLLGVEQAPSPSEDALRFKVKFQLAKGKKMVASQDPALVQARVFLLSLTEAAVQNQAALLTRIIAQVLQSVAANGITYATDIKTIKGEGELAAEEQAAAAQNGGAPVDTATEGEAPVEGAPVEEAPAADQAQPEAQPANAEPAPAPEAQPEAKPEAQPEAQPEAKPAEEKKEEKPAEEAKKEPKEEVKNESLLDLSARLSEAGEASVYETYIDLYPSGRVSSRSVTGSSRTPSNLETIYANMSDKEKKKFNRALAKGMARGNGPSFLDRLTGYANWATYGSPGGYGYGRSSGLTSSRYTR